MDLTLRQRATSTVVRAAAALAVASAVACAPITEGTRGFMEKCAIDADCEQGLSCFWSVPEHRRSYSADMPEAVCSMECSQSRDCEERFGQDAGCGILMLDSAWVEACVSTCTKGDAGLAAALPRMVRDGEVCLP
jgi:hypothetical protein